MVITEENKIFDILLNMKEGMGGLEIKVSFLVEDAKKKNGYIDHINQRMIELEIKVGETIPKVYEFMLGKKQEEQDHKNWKGNLSLQLIGGSVLLVVGIVLALTFEPLLRNVINLWLK